MMRMVWINAFLFWETGELLFHILICKHGYKILSSRSSSSTKAFFIVPKLAHITIVVV